MDIVKRVFKRFGGHLPSDFMAIYQGTDYIGGGVGIYTPDHDSKPH
jgi:hypothetical protein